MGGLRDLSISFFFWVKSLLSFFLKTISRPFLLFEFGGGVMFFLTGVVFGDLFFLTGVVFGDLFFLADVVFGDAPSFLMTLVLVSFFSLVGVFVIL